MFFLFVSVLSLSFGSFFFFFLCDSSCSAIPEPRFDGLQSLRVSELRQVLERHNVSHDDCLEKEELIAKIIFIESTQPGEKEKKKSEKKLKKETKKKVFLRGVIGRHESHDDCLEKQVLIAKIIFIETKPGEKQRKRDRKKRKKKSEKK